MSNTQQLGPASSLAKPLFSARACKERHASCRLVILISIYYVFSPVLSLTVHLANIKKGDP